jgi:hypothetical protein
MVDHSLHFPIQKPVQILKPSVPRGSNILCTAPVVGVSELSVDCNLDGLYLSDLDSEYRA